MGRTTCVFAIGTLGSPLPQDDSTLGELSTLSTFGKWALVSRRVSGNGKCCKCSWLARLLVPTPYVWYGSGACRRCRA